MFVLIIVIAPIIDSLTPYFYKQFVDKIPTHDYDLLLKILLFYIGIRFMALLFSTSRFLVGDILGVDAVANTIATVFAHIHNLDFAFHSSKSSGSLISAIKRGEGAFWNLYFSIHYRIVDVSVRFFVLLYFFKNLNSFIFIMTIVTFVLAILIMLVFVKMNVERKRKVNELEDDISSVIVDNMINFETVKLFVKELWEQRRLSVIQVDWRKAVWKYVYTFRGLDVSMGTVINISIFSILLYSLNMTITGIFTLGDFVLIAVFLQSFFPYLFELVWGFRDIAKSYSDIEKFFGILDYGVEIKDPENPVELEKIRGEIKYNNVTFTYSESKKEAVEKINLNIRQGQSIALVGRSGSGKTTLIKLLMRFYDVDQGMITVDGVDVRKFTKSHLRSFMGVVPQEPVLFNNTIEYNIGYGKEKVTKEEIVAAAKIANLHDFVLGMPKKYKTHVGERGIKLSGGQKQRLAIARMILSEPDIIIFDEATSQLDSENEKLIQDALWKVTKNKTTVIIAHRLSTAMRADKIVVMDKGKIVESGSHSVLLGRDKSLYKHFWNLQINAAQPIDIGATIKA
ncbi:MAG: ABC transporter [Candidatus Woesebacteria bacterium GW2011_GWB1_38_8]|uniref:ABC transporter n=1 Tax=Candidatus Woesebacteria bacterium GW2011_GWB1_38_8 TaxID=1618570 RepID=A0A0G0L1Q0_9BACT|nr:MAG: ABC transporter [Candidatus Woesebacteria bacterium GW2011_GWB1_38_8]